MVKLFRRHDITCATREAPVEEPEPEPEPIEEPEFPDDPGPAEDPERQPVREDQPGWYSCRPGMSVKSARFSVQRGARRLIAQAAGPQ